MTIAVTVMQVDDPKLPWRVKTLVRETSGGKLLSVRFVRARTEEDAESEAGKLRERYGLVAA